MQTARAIKPTDFNYLSVQEEESEIIIYKKIKTIYQYVLWYKFFQDLFENLNQSMF